MRLAVIHPRCGIRSHIPGNSGAASLLPRIFRLNNDKIAFNLRNIIVACERSCLQRIGKHILARPGESLRASHIERRAFKPDKAIAAYRDTWRSKRRSVIDAARGSGSKRNNSLQHLPRRRHLARKVAICLNGERIRSGVGCVFAGERIRDRQPLVCDRLDGDGLHRAVVFRIRSESNRELILCRLRDVERIDLYVAVCHLICNFKTVIVIGEVASGKPHIALSGISALRFVGARERGIGGNIVKLVVCRYLIAGNALLFGIVNMRRRGALHRDRYGTLRHRKRSGEPFDGVVCGDILGSIADDAHAGDDIRNNSVVRRPILRRRHHACAIERNLKLVAGLERREVRRRPRAVGMGFAVIDPAFACRSHGYRRRALGDRNRAAGRYCDAIVGEARVGARGKLKCGGSLPGFGARGKTGIDKGFAGHQTFRRYVGRR